MNSSTGNSKRFARFALMKGRIHFIGTPCTLARPGHFCWTSGQIVLESRIWTDEQVLWSGVHAAEPTTSSRTGSSIMRQSHVDGHIFYAVVVKSFGNPDKSKEDNLSEVCPRYFILSALQASQTCLTAACLCSCTRNIFAVVVV